ncbi:asparagine synthase (glutamine-hydrolyzing) [Pseudoxanthomonas putridarboris]|uniref:asparagine synthase (glutamine-hydrolyzing) n=1 Tax=Pseudoxanthomonas putridarboris TaxID=752605 RepID=A0ABU9J0N1_9GAMM
MCGIAGLVVPAGAPSPSEPMLAAMIAALRHRGPDGSRVRIDGQVGLAHARLSIIDPEGGWQPIHNPDRTVWVIFNGEIFNHVELRETLERLGHRFYTDSDTEVIVHLYDRYGDDFVEHLNGQFAIALHDTRRQRLVLARDRVGIRPLYVSRHGGGVAFASEVKALYARSGQPRGLDVRALGETFSFWSTLGTRTVFAGIEQLAPGHTMAFDLRDPALAPVVKRYWQWRHLLGDGAWRSEDDVAEELHALLVDAVRLQLRADVPVGAYLSGGLDSSVIATLIRRHTPTPLRTFSLGFADAEFDERPYQRLMAESLGTEHSEVVVSHADIAAAFHRAVLHAEAPLVRTAPVPLMLLAGHVRQAGYKVVLTGEGADEVFAGYDLFKEAKLRRFMARQPDSPWRGRLLERLYPYLAHSPVRSRGFAERFFQEGAGQLGQPWFAHLPRVRSTQRVLRFLHPDLREQLQAWDPLRTLAEQLPPDIDGWPALARDQHVESATLLSGYLLSSQGDRMSMAQSVEGRYPFLDHRVIELANRMPAHYKLRGLREKHILKRAMRDELPEAVLRRHKQPYRAPDSACFFAGGEALPWVRQALQPDRLAACGLFDTTAVDHLVEKCRNGRAIGFPDNMAFVGILSMLALHEAFVQGRGEA